MESVYHIKPGSAMKKSLSNRVSLQKFPHCLPDGNGLRCGRRIISGRKGAYSVN